MMNIRVCLYKDWMKEQVIDMFCNQYGVSRHEFNAYFDRFYEAPFQKDKGIRIVALDGRKVAGFQSFFYWPYEYNRNILNSFQSGNSLVHPAYRGKGIFQLLLNFIYENNAHLGISFLMGFPVEASKNSFLRNQWKNILNLQWYVKILNPLYRIKKNKRVRECFDPVRTLFPDVQTKDTFRLSRSEAFLNWRKGFSVRETYFPVYEHDGKKVQFEISMTKRKKIITELIIGDIRSNTQETEVLRAAFRDLFSRCRRSGRISMISIALNPMLSNRQVLDVIKTMGFKQINRKIYFIVKSFSAKETAEDPSKWALYRSDIDTW